MPVGGITYNQKKCFHVSSIACVKIESLSLIVNINNESYICIKVIPSGNSGIWMKEFQQININNNKSVSNSIVRAKAGTFGELIFVFKNVN